LRWEGWLGWGGWELEGGVGGGEEWGFAGVEGEVVFAGDFVEVFIEVFVGVWGDFADVAGAGEVDARGFGEVAGGVDGAGEGLGSGFGAGVGGIGAGDLEAVEESGGALDVEVAGGEGVDDLGGGEQDGVAVLKRGELDVPAGEEIAAGGVAAAVGGVGGVEAAVEVAEGRAGEGGAAAL
jgi:hypothetical protein